MGDMQVPVFTAANIPSDTKANLRDIRGSDPDFFGYRPEVGGQDPAVLVDLDNIPELDMLKASVLSLRGSIRRQAERNMEHQPALEQLQTEIREVRADDGVLEQAQSTNEELRAEKSRREEQFEPRLLERRLKDATTEAEDASRALEGPELLSNFQPYLEQKIAHRRRQMMLEKLRQRMRDGSIG